MEPTSVMKAMILTVSPQRGQRSGEDIVDAGEQHRRPITFRASGMFLSPLALVLGQTPARPLRGSRHRRPAWVVTAARSGALFANTPW